MNVCVNVKAVRLPFYLPYPPKRGHGSYLEGEKIISSFLYLNFFSVASSLRLALLLLPSTFSILLLYVLVETERDGVKK